MLLGYIKLNQQDFERGFWTRWLSKSPTLVWPVSARQLGGGSDRLWRCRWSWCGPCIYQGSMRLQVGQNTEQWVSVHGYKTLYSSVCPHPWRPCCWGGATVMEKAGKVVLERTRAARGWSRRCWRWRGQLVRQRRRRWADSGSIAPLVHPPPSLPMDKPGDTTEWRHSCVTNVSV